MDIRKLRLNNGKTVEGLLKFEAYRLKKLLQEEISIWYAKQPEPVMYQRTFGLRDSIYVDDYCYVDFDSRNLTISIKFTDAAYHKSIVDNSVVNIIQLLENGYEVQKPVWFRDIPNMGYRKPGHFIQKAIERFNHDNKLGISVKVNY